MTKEYITLIVWVVVLAAIFGFLWWQGHLVSLRNYILETREELRKCTWPSWSELKGSTVVVMISVAMLGIFTIGVDYVLLLVVQWITQV